MANELPILGHSAPPVPILPVSQKQPAVVKEIIVTRASAPAPVKPTPTSKATQRLKKPSDGKRRFVPKPITTVYRKVPFSAKRAAALDRLNQDYRQDVRDSFRIDYADLTGQKKVFIFDLLPSIENRASNKMGSIEVPEAKPGILRRVDTKHKNIIIPGGTPVVQSIGIDKALLNLVGCFTGADDSYDKVPDVDDLTDAKLDNNVLMSAVGESKDPSDSAIKASEKFYEDVVIPMTEVKVTIESSNGPGEGIEARVYKGVIVTFKEYAVRQNKTFYTIDLLITEYPRAPEPKLEEAKVSESKSTEKTDSEQGTADLAKDFQKYKSTVVLGLLGKQGRKDYNNWINEYNLNVAHNTFFDKYEKQISPAKLGALKNITSKEALDYLNKLTLDALRAGGGGSSTTPSNTTTGSNTSDAPQAVNNPATISPALKTFKQAALEELKNLPNNTNTDNGNFDGSLSVLLSKRAYELWKKVYGAEVNYQPAVIETLNTIGEGGWTKQELIDMVNSLKDSDFKPIQ